MFEKDRDYLSIDQLASERIVVAENSLPQWVNRDRIGLNQRRLETILRLGGIGCLVITGDSDGEISRSVPMVAGYNPSGEAYAAKAVTITIVPTHSEGLNDDYSKKPNFNYLRWPTATLVLNDAEINNRIREDGEDSRSAKAWSSYMDEALKEGVGRMGRRNLISDLYGVDIFAAAVQCLTTIYLGNSWIRMDVLGPYSVLGYLAQYIVARLPSTVDTLRNKGRLSIFPGPQLDRALLMTALLKTSKLVKPLP